MRPWDSTGAAGEAVPRQPSASDANWKGALPAITEYILSRTFRRLRQQRNPAWHEPGTVLRQSGLRSRRHPISYRRNFGNVVRAKNTTATISCHSPAPASFLRAVTDTLVLFPAIYVSILPMPTLLHRWHSLTQTRGKVCAPSSTMTDIVWHDDKPSAHAYPSWSLDLLSLQGIHIAGDRRFRQHGRKCGKRSGHRSPV